MDDKAGRKVAVDVRFAFDTQAARRAQPHAEFHEVSSDRYFGELCDPGEQFDVIFLDGLHRFEQTLRDLLNAQTRLKPKGVIVIDDVRPNSAIAALPVQADALARRAAGDVWDGSWMGDVYRLVFAIESYFQSWSYRTTTDNLGQLVMWRGARPAVVERDMELVSRLTYEAVLAHPEAFRFAPFRAIRSELAQALGLSERQPGWQGLLPEKWRWG